MITSSEDLATIGSSEDPVTTNSTAKQTSTPSTGTADDATAAMARSNAAAKPDRLARIGVAAVAAALIIVAAIIDTSSDDVFAEPKFRVALTAAALLAGAVALSGARLHLELNLVDHLVIAYVAWCGLAFLLAPDKGVQWVGEPFQFQGMASVLIYAVVYAAVRRFVSSQGHILQLGWWILAAAAFVAAYGLVQRLGIDPIWSTLLDGRIFSTIGNPNPLATVLVATVPLGLYWVRRGTPAERAVAISAVAAGVSALAFTESRGGFVAFLAVVGVVATAKTNRMSRRTLEVSAAAVLVVVSLAIAVAPARDQVSASWERATSSLDGADDSRRFHVDGWRATVAMIADHPIVGVGHELFPEEFPAYRDSTLSDESIARFSPYRLESPHNLLLAIAVGAGLPAALLFVAAVAVALARWRRSEVDAVLRVSVTAAMVGYLVASQFVTADLTSSMVFWTLLGCVASMHRADDIIVL